jgi:hypothetical protein
VYYNKGIEDPFGVCSRNLNLDKDETNAFWKVALNYGLEEKFAALNENIYVQLELCGEGVQKNPLQLKGLDAFAFNVFFLDKGVYGGKEELLEICKKLGLKTVPIEDEYVFNHTLDDLIKSYNSDYKSQEQIHFIKFVNILRTFLYASIVKAYYSEEYDNESIGYLIISPIEDENLRNIESKTSGFGDALIWAIDDVLNCLNIDVNDEEYDEDWVNYSKNYEKMAETISDQESYDFPLIEN